MKTKYVDIIIRPEDGADVNLDELEAEVLKLVESKGIKAHVWSLEVEKGRSEQAA